MENNESLPDALEPDVDRALVDALTHYDEQLRRGVPSTLFDGVDADVTAGFNERADADGAQACLEFLERAFPRSGHAADAPAADRIGRFELLQVLGQGGFGVVYLARDPRLDRLVALKVPRMHTLGNRTLHERFLREARAAAALDHPHIVPILETGEIGPVCYIAAAYCEGSDLGNWLKANAPVAPRLAAQIIGTLADAVQYSHSRGILHRDLKPSNVLLTVRDVSGNVRTDELPFVLRITDFGLARFTEDAIGETGSAVVGTPLYMSPEQALGQNEKIGPATDIYALGAILYESLTGRPPFQGTGFIDVLDQIRLTDPVPLSRFVKSVPRDLETICLKCLAKEPNRRYGTAEALRTDLQAFLEGRAIAARPLGAAEIVVKWARRRPLAAALAFVVTAALASLVALQWRHAQILARNFETTDALRIEALAREAELRLQSNAAEINAAQFDLCIGFRNNISRAARRLESVAKAAGNRSKPAEGLEPEWNFVMRMLEPSPPEWVFTGHQGAAFSVATAPDRNVIASGDAKGNVRIWDLTTGKEVASIAAHEGEVRALAFSPDGKFLVSGGQPHHLKLWNTVDWRMERSAGGHEMTVTCLDWRPDGAQIASGSRDGTIRLSKAVDLTMQKTLEVGAVVNRVRYSPDGLTMYSSDKGNSVSKWKLDEDSTDRVELVHTESNPLTLDFSRDGRIGITGCITFFAIDGNRLRVDAHVFSRAAVFARTGNWAATGGGEGVIDLWRWTDNPLQGTSQQRWRGHGDEGFGDFAATPDGSRLITAGLDGLVKVWRIADFAHPTRQWLRGHSASVNSLAFSRDDTLVASAGDDGRVRVYETMHGRLIDTLDLSQQGVKLRMLDFGADDRTLFVVADRPASGIIVWKPGSSAPHEFIPTPEVLSLAMAPDGTHLAIGFAQGKGAVLWNTATRNTVQTLFEPPAGALHMQFTPNGRLLAVKPRGTDTNFILLVDVETGTRREISGTNSDVNGLAFDDNGERLLFVTEGYLLQVVDSTTTAVIDSFHLSGAPAEIGRPCFSPDGQVVAFAVQSPGGETGNVQIFHLGARRAVLTLEPVTLGATDVRFSHDGRMLACVTPKPDADGNAGIVLWRFDPPRAAPQ